MSKAYIKQIGGSPGIVVDGKAYPPMAMTARAAKPEYLRSLGKSGLKIFFQPGETDWTAPGCFERFAGEVRKILAEIPDAYIIARVGLYPPLRWYDENPGELMRYSDGSLVPAVLDSDTYYAEISGMYGLYSEKFRIDAKRALLDFCSAVDASDFGERVIGYFLASGGTSEWYPVNSITGNGKGAYGDTSPAFKRVFSAFLRKKYKTEEAFREAWNMKNISFDDPDLPTLPARGHINADKEIVDAMLNYESAYRDGKTLNLNAEGVANLGVFLNVDKFQYVADFYDAMHEGIADTIVYLAKALRSKHDGKLVGAFYGSYGCTDFYDAGTTTGTLTILDSGVVDFLAAPGVYNNREPGGYVAQREMQDSFRLRNQMFVVEEDSRTHLEDAFYRDAMGLYHVEDAVNALKRDFARNICEDLFAWWYDQHKEGGRYQHEAFYRLFGQQAKIAEAAYRLDRRKNSEIALIYDHESVHCVSYWTNNLMLDLYRTSDLGRIGAPVDYYFHDDMARDDMPDYKLYLMINTFVLTEAQRGAIIAKARKNGATLLWLYAPGFIHPERQKRMDNRNIEELTGMKVGRLDKTVSPKFRLVQEYHPALRFGDRDRLYGYIDRDVHSNVWLGTALQPPYMNPGFYIDDDSVEILGRYCESGLAAFGLKTMDGYTSAYCAPQILRSELIASLAAYSGCHIYSSSDDCIYANRHFLAIHAAYAGERTIRFPAEVSPFEVYEERCYGHNTREISITMRLGETLMFQF